MTDNASDDYQRRSYGAIPVGTGEKPGIVVVDFQPLVRRLLLREHHDRGPETVPFDKFIIPSAFARGRQPAGHPRG